MHLPPRPSPTRPCAALRAPAPDAPRRGAGGNFWVYQHDYVTGEELACNKGHHGPVYGVRFKPDGTAYASAGDDGTIRFWNFALPGGDAPPAPPE